MGIYLGLLAILFVLIGIVVLLPLPNLRKTNNLKPNPTPSPTPIEIKKLTPTAKLILVTPTGTGAKEDVPKEVEDMAQQKQNLKKKLPLQLPDFTIEFDYTTDKFIVAFTGQNKDSLSIFKQWLKDSYPLLTTDKFSFK